MHAQYGTIRNLPEGIPSVSTNFNMFPFVDKIERVVEAPYKVKHQGD